MKVSNAGRGIVADAPFRVTVELARWMRDTLQVIGFVRCAPHAGGWKPDWLDLLEAEELGELTDAGFGVDLYQIYWGRRQVTAEDGREAGEALVEHCKKIGMPDGCTLWSDCESFRSNADTMGYLESWVKRVAFITDTRGPYCGSNFLLPNMGAKPDAREQGEALWRLKGINRYWASMSQVYTPSVRGHCLGQAWEYVLWGEGPPIAEFEAQEFKEKHGREYVPWHVVEFDPNNPKHKNATRFDLNASRRDALGGRMRWAVK